MQRTYKSKKEMGGALDPREVIFSLDDKCSAFDAFYINNIKQTKREMSCIGSTNQHNSASNRVRKRKYVKRIIKEVDTPPLRESMSTSTYLTPDKSIHVNRCQDLFDQLLNSSSPHVQKTETKKDDLFNQLLLTNEEKTVTTKDVTSKNSRKSKKKFSKALIKKINCSSSDATDSDKENSHNNICIAHNATDLRKHQLIIEKEPKLIVSPKYQDKSINQIVNDLSFINNIMKCQTPRNNKKNKYISKSKLTTSSMSPGSGPDSPLCSTPFVQKYRGKSIYNISPILIRHLDKSKIDIINESEIPFKNYSVNENKDEIEVSSPILKSSKDNILHSTSTKSQRTKSFIMKRQKNTVNDNDTPEKEDNLVKDSLIQYSTEYNPFLGFTYNSSRITTNVEQFSLDFASGNINKKSKDKSATIEKSEELNDIFENNSYPDENVIQLSTDVAPFLGFSENSIKSNKDTFNNDESFDNNGNGDDYYNDENTILENAELKYEEEVKTEDNISKKISSSQANTIKDFDSSICNSDSASEYEHEQIDNSESDVDNSLYNTCTSLNESLSENNNSPSSNSGLSNLNHYKFETKKLVVELNRLNDSTFYRYYSKNTDSKSISSCCSNNSDNSSYQECNEEDNTVINKSQLNDNEDEDVVSSNKDEGCVSFVTTRRRNNVTDVSVIMHLIESDNSDTDSEDNKTILSNRAENNTDYTISGKEKFNLENDDDITTAKAGYLSPNTSEVPTRDSSSNQNEFSFFSNDSRMEKKAPIVLQPGKKWERSLSIYRRMTMMPESNLSMFDEADSTKKGRNYCQSIVTTMHLQKDIGGPLHNESFTSCRSSIASKRHRATIKIVKEPNSSKLSLHRTAEYEDLTSLYGFVHEDCDDTVIDLSKLSIADSDLDVTVVQDSVDRLTTARDYVLRRCNQKGPILFDECYPDTVLKNCHKIGEGVYGEVFLWRARDGRARVMKVVPIAGTIRVNGEQQKDFHEVISEVVIAMELSALRAPIADIENHFDAGKNDESLDLHTIENATDCFNEVLAVRCVVGKYPSRLLELWELYDECKGSENDSPELLPGDQHYLVLELANAGLDLETFEFTSAEQAHALFYQVAFALAVGEESIQFEHRDLHWGNILIAPTDEKYATFILRGRSHRVLRRGVAATIIDYSLSRISLPLVGSERATLYNDLATDDSLFDAVGDYQFDVYRSMRDKLGNDWKNFEPYTNILWLHYVVDKMITALRYKRVNTKVHKHFIGKLKGIKSRLLNYGSTAQFVLTDNEF